MSKQFKSFTILEALISLMLISIIISLTYSVFNLIGKQMTLFEKEGNEVFNYNLFDTTLQCDIDKAVDFTTAENTLHLKYYNEDTIEYQINKDYILRKNKFSIDTFKIKSFNYSFIGESKSYNLNETLNLAFSVLKDTIRANYFLRKDYSQIINHNYFNED